MHSKLTNELGFESLETQPLLNVARRAIVQAIDELAAQLQENDLVLFYFSGHVRRSAILSRKFMFLSFCHSVGCMKRATACRGPSVMAKTTSAALTTTASIFTRFGLGAACLWPHGGLTA
jgi:hypothetical protein